MAKLKNLKAKPGAQAKIGLVTDTGDTAWSIAQQFSGNGKNWTALVDANPDHFSQNLKMKKGLPLILPEGWNKGEFEPSGL
jgi:nucleoid-associated protein YgaU